YKTIKELKKKRDKLIHPKNKEDILNASAEKFTELKIGFKSYTSMINSIMDGFFISIELKNIKDIRRLF
ncbi:MAG: hypothetical protein ACJAX3_002266, partial [Patiriisocius sp.]